MHVVLGAWGIGKFLASHSDTWKFRFGKNPNNTITLPPMSSVLSGMIEVLPFVLGTKIFVDSEQYEFLSRGNDPSWRLDKNLSSILHEFENSDIIKPISFRSLIKPKIAKLLQIVDNIIDHSSLPAASAESRRLWRKFLHTDGASFLPYLAQEIGNAETHQEDYRLLLSSSDFPEIQNIYHRSQLSLAALKCGHDIFDVVSMLSVASDLGAYLCDWHMYEPFYALVIKYSTFGFALQGTPPASQESVRWYVPIPKNLDLDQIWKLREEPYIIALRNKDISKRVATFKDLNSPAAWRDLHRSIQDKVRGIVLNPYNAYPQDGGAEVLTESLREKRTVFNSNERLATIPERLLRNHQVDSNINPQALQPVRIFISYSRRDQSYIDGLLAHLAVLQRQNLITVWLDSEVAAGTEWSSEIRRHLEMSDIILLMISADYLASNSCWGIELMHAMQRHYERTATVIPISLRPCDWQSTRLSLSFKGCQVMVNQLVSLSSRTQRGQRWLILSASSSSIGGPSADIQPLITSPIQRTAVEAIGRRHPRLAGQ